MRLTDDQKMLLCRIAARTDGLWLPMRFASTRAMAYSAVAEQRQRYRTAGLPIVAGGDDATRKGHERLLGSLEGGKLLELRRRGSRAVSGRLTPLGDDVAGLLLPRGTVFEAWPLLKDIAKTERRFGGRSNSGFLLENDCWGLRDPRKLTIKEDEVLPLLIRGWAEAASDTAGRIGYRITPSGRVALEAGRPPRPAPVEYAPELADEYGRLYREAEHDRDAWFPDQPNFVAIPLSAGRWPTITTTTTTAK